VSEEKVADIRLEEASVHAATPWLERAPWFRLGRSSLATGYANARATWRTPGRRMGLAVVVGVFVLLPWLASPYVMGIAIVMGLALPGAIALSALQGMAGQVSAGNAAFMAIGGLSVAAVLRAAPGMPFLLNLLIGGITAAIAGAIIAIPAIRVRGLYLLITTLALQFIVQYIFQEYQAHSVGDGGFVFGVPTIGSFQIASDDRWYFMLLIFGAFLLYAMKNWAQSRVGRSWIAIREGEDAAAILGVDVRRTKIMIFTVTSFVIGIQGVLFAYYSQDIQYTLFTFDLAVQYIAIVIIGGQGSVLGVVYGTVFVIGLPYVLQRVANILPAGMPGGAVIRNNIFNLEEIIYGALIVLFLLVAPGGLVELWGRIVHRIRAWPFSSSASGQTWE
jgi:branched-chain amino acid transport system permease protein